MKSKKQEGAYRGQQNDSRMDNKTVREVSSQTVNTTDAAETDPEHPHNQAVAAELRAELARSKKKLIQVANETGIQYQALGRYLNGGRPIRVAALVLIATALDTTASQILDRAQDALKG